MDPLATLREGTVLPRYRVTTPLPPRGAVARCLAHQSGLDREVELRVIPLPGGAEAEATPAALQELSRVDHPRITRALDVGRFEEHAYYSVVPRDALPLVDWVGGPGGRMTASDALDLGVVLAELLVELERTGVRFWGLTPETLAYDRSAGQVVLDDVPAERLLPPGARPDGAGPTSWAWRLSEWGRGQEPGPATDVRLLGQTLYFVVTGKVPEEQPGRLPEWGDRSDGLPALRALADQAMDPGTEGRPTASQLREALLREGARRHIVAAVKSTTEAAELQQIATRSGIFRPEDFKLESRAVARPSPVEPRSFATRAAGWVDARSQPLALGAVALAMAWLVLPAVEIPSGAATPPPSSAAERLLNGSESDARLREAAEALTREAARARGTPTEAAAFLSTWTVVRDWLILLPPAQRAERGGYASLLDLQGRFRRGDPAAKAEACRTLDRFLLGATDDEGAAASPPTTGTTTP